MAIYIGPGSLQYFLGIERDGSFVACPRLRFGGAQFLRNVLFRQSHDLALLVPADVFSRGPWVIYRYFHYARTINRSKKNVDSTPTSFSDVPQMQKSFCEGLKAAR